MAGTKFQYDESGTTFFYFVLTFLAMVIIPCTYFFWPRDDDEDERRRMGRSDNETRSTPMAGTADAASYRQRLVRCRCEPCIMKDHYLKLREPSRTVRKRLTKLVLVVAWIGLLAFAYKVAQIQPDYVTFDPFEILGIDPQASGAEIKKAYRRLSLVYHPDKETGDEKKFMRITKAYAALTDEQARKNWEEYGNPDGPGAMSFGIALPSWIVEKENSMFVLLVYVLMLMIVLPVCVRMWWSNSSKYGDFKVLLDTSHLYLYYINKSPHMMLRRVLMVLCASYEFEKSHNSEIRERPSDNVDIPKLMKMIPNLATNNRERPLCFEYSLKARTLMYAHLMRITLPSPGLEQDRKYLVTKMPYLIQEFVQCASQLTYMYVAKRVQRCPSLETMENAMRLNALVVQAMWANKNSMLQLPHISEDMLRYFVNRRRNIRNMQQLAALPHVDRRQMLQRLSDDQYWELVNVLGQMPLLEVNVRYEVNDDDDPTTVTAGALVTVFVKLRRRPMSVSFEDGLDEGGDEDPTSLATETSADPAPPTEQKQPASKPWGKSKSGGGKKKTKPKNRKPQPAQQQRRTVTATAAAAAADSTAEHSDHSAADDKAMVETSHPPADSDDEAPPGGQSAAEHDDDDDDDDWSIVKQNLPKKEIFKTVSRISHSVHCPYYPEDKQEHWWIYITDRKKQMIKTSPYFMTNLVDTEEVDLKFIAPQEPGSYQYQVNVRCDSYVDMDYFKTLKVDVKEAPKQIGSHPQWEMSEEEDEAQPEDDSAASDSDLIASDDDDGDDGGAADRDDYELEPDDEPSE